MSEILYLKLEKNTCTYNRTVTLGEVAELQCVDKAIVHRLKTEKLHTFHEIRKGRHRCAAREVFSVVDVVKLIQEVYPGLEVQNLGEPDFIVEYSTKHRENRVLTLLKVTLVCLICFLGAAFSIMTFHEDVSVATLFGKIYELMTGKAAQGPTILELTYSVGLSAGILVFFNHWGARQLAKEPTPIEVEMRLYEEDVNTTLINTVSRETKHPKDSEE